tara:strand:+ start:1753 stop:2154 length:402 start_codon:yes stop_codon:yes gene_type:complete
MQQTPSQEFAETMTIAESGGVVWREEPDFGPPAETLASLAAIEQSAKAVAADAAKLIGAANDALRGVRCALRLAAAREEHSSLAAAPSWTPYPPEAGRQRVPIAAQHAPTARPPERHSPYCPPTLARRTPLRR